MATFATTIPHKAGTEIELFGEVFAMEQVSPLEWRGSLTTDTELVIERLREIPEGFAEVHEPMVGRPAQSPAPAPVADATAVATAPEASGEPAAESDAGPGTAGLTYQFTVENGSTIDLLTMKVADLRALAEANNIAFSTSLSKPELRDLIAKALTD